MFLGFYDNADWFSPDKVFFTILWNVFQYGEIGLIARECHKITKEAKRVGNILHKLGGSVDDHKINEFVSL